MRAIRFVISIPWTLKGLGQQSCAVSEGDYWFSCINSSTTIPLAPRTARGNDIRGPTDFGARGGKATGRRLLAVADRRDRVPKRLIHHISDVEVQNHS
jgi:hypothetical protein